jgi:hypothetical protein
MFFYCYLLFFTDILRIFVPHLYHENISAKSQIQSCVVILQRITNTNKD